MASTRTSLDLPGMAIPVHAEIIDLTAPDVPISLRSTSGITQPSNSNGRAPPTSRTQKRSVQHDTVIISDDSDNEASLPGHLTNAIASSSGDRSRQSSPHRSAADSDDRTLRQTSNERVSRITRREDHIENYKEGRSHSGTGSSSRYARDRDLVAHSMANDRRRSASPPTRERQRDVESDRNNRRAYGHDRDNTKSSSSGKPKKKSPRSRGKDKRSGESLFYIDVESAAIPADLMVRNGEKDGKDVESGLLLPSHVTIQTTEDYGDADAGPDVPVNLPSPHESDDEDFIQYLDREEIQNGIRRYFDPDSSDNDQKQVLVVCKHCGAEGNHKTSACTVIICLTCGVHNEHSTRSCPISKTCFSCNMKGHISKDCPNRYSRGRRSDSDRLSMFCDRCGMDVHASRSCPTLWRQYEYVSDSRRDAILAERREKVDCEFGQGGEGYIGEDEWCYNCGGVGHLGDDCTTVRRPFDAPKEPSAFSTYNTLSGPFADEQAPRSNRRPVRRREWEIGGNFDDGHGFAGPSDVGKRGRDKERERMRKKERESQRGYDEDEDDWFSRDRRRTGGERGERGNEDRRRGKGDTSGRSSRQGQNKNVSVSINLKKRQDGGLDGKRSLIDRIALDGSQPAASRDLNDASGRKSRDRYRDVGNGGRRNDDRGRFARFEDERSRQQYFGGYGR